MAWEKIFKKSKNCKSNRDWDITISVATHKAQREIMTISFEQSIAENIGASFIAEGQFVDAYHGAGEHFGKLRVVPGHSFELFKIGAKQRKLTRLSIKIPLSSGFNGERLSRQRAEYEIGDDEIIITLPALVLGGTAKTAELQPSEKGPTPTTPYRMGAPSHAEVLRAKGVRV